MPAHLTSRRSLARAVVSAGAALAMLLSAACGDDDVDGRVVPDVLEDDGLPTQPAAPTTVPQTCDPTEMIEVTEDDAPEVASPGGDRPTELGIEDLEEGDGHEVADGDTVQVLYTGVLFSDGTEFDTAWDDLSPFEVMVGTGSVVPGFDQGLVGMRPGGRRQLVIPAELGYGDQESGEIPADSDLVFVVDLLQVCYPEGEAADGEEAPDEEAPGEEAPGEEAPDGEAPEEPAPDGAEAPTEGEGEEPPADDGAPDEGDGGDEAPDAEGPESGSDPEA